MALHLQYYGSWALLLLLRMMEDLLPQDHGEVWTQDQQVQEEEAGHVLLPLGGVYWESPSTAVPACSEAKKCQLLSISVQLYCSAALHANQT